MAPVAAKRITVQKASRRYVAGTAGEGGVGREAIGPRPGIIEFGACETSDLIRSWTSHPQRRQMRASRSMSLVALTLLTCAVRYPTESP